jgi:hypothetical protein
LLCETSGAAQAYDSHGLNPPIGCTAPTAVLGKLRAVLGALSNASPSNRAFPLVLYKKLALRSRRPFDGLASLPFTDLPSLARAFVAPICRSTSLGEGKADMLSSRLLTVTAVGPARMFGPSRSKNELYEQILVDDLSPVSLLADFVLSHLRWSRRQQSRTSVH